LGSPFAGIITGEELCAIRKMIMGWATHAIERLKNGETVIVKPRGHSMHGKIESGQAVIIRPITGDEIIKEDDIVLCKVRGMEYLHLVKGVKDGQYLIGNNRGCINGWISRHQIFGKFAGFAA